MLRHFVRTAVFVLSLLPAIAAAEPIRLKLSFFSSDRSMSFLAAIKPFVDAVNAEAKGLLAIDVYFSAKDIPQQAQMVLDDTVDIAFVVPGYTPQLFPDNTVVELPGLFHDMREATLVYTGLVAQNALRGYQDFFVIGAFVTQPETIHGRVAINSIEDLNGKRIRVNNPSEAKALGKLGAIPVPLAINQIAEALSSATIDAAAVPMTPLTDFGINRVATHHYFLDTNGAPLALLMNQKRFDALPLAAQTIIRKHSGEWAAERFINIYEGSDKKVLAQLKSETRRALVFPSAHDLTVAQSAFKAVVAEWSSSSDHNRELLALTNAEIAKVRSSN